MSTEDYGPCCACGQSGDAVRNILMLDFEAPAGFEGWGCFQCGIPSRGAVAIVCDACVSREPQFIAGGKYLADKVRIRLDDYARRPFGHVLARHPEQMEGRRA